MGAQRLEADYKAVTDAEKAEVVALGGLHVVGTERHVSPCFPFFFLFGTSYPSAHLGMNSPPYFQEACCKFLADQQGTTTSCEWTNLQRPRGRRCRTTCSNECCLCSYGHCGSKDADFVRLLFCVGQESRRIDNQLRGRSGRQGDLGSTRFFLSLEDK